MPMPSEHIVPAIHDQSQPEQSQGQNKVCSACHCPLSVDSATPPYILHDSQDSSDTGIVCGPCRNRLLPLRSEPSPAGRDNRDGLFADVERQLLRRAASFQGGRNEVLALRQDATGHVVHATTVSRLDEDMEMEAPAASSQPSAPFDSDNSFASSSAVPEKSQAASASTSTRPALIAINTHGISTLQVVRLPQGSQPASSPSAVASSGKYRSRANTVSSLDPLVDITRLRVRSQGHHCLYPGATFQGTQKSGRNSYDVNVTIVDVDFSSSHLCGYLRIRGLTDDWPELTTYFDAEIIGSRYGFLTRNWGATEQEDMVHWARFPAFRHVRHELKKPHLTMKDANRGAVFMRWKEKFLVPDHRVQDINGASFAGMCQIDSCASWRLACPSSVMSTVTNKWMSYDPLGFYYVCVDFNPQQSSAQLAQPNSETPAQALSPSAQSPSAKPESVSRARRTSTNQGARRVARSSSRGVLPSNVATMSGFYFHQNSEPYQQLSLVHVPEHTTSCFEFR
ncbi:hypothetical protein AcV7_008875 [Taiwanofungus camphoratus]|nr:hypothetical protein AcV7_008875 [Antrodia cinnamomea]